MEKLEDGCFIALFVFIVCSFLFALANKKAKPSSSPRENYIYEKSTPKKIEVVEDVNNYNFIPTTRTRRSIVHSNSSSETTPDDAYDEGYEAGYSQGMLDKENGNGHGCGYDDSNDYYDYYEESYIEGYEEGYNDGYNNGEAPEDED